MHNFIKTNRRFISSHLWIKNLVMMVKWKFWLYVKEDLKFMQCTCWYMWDYGYHSTIGIFPTNQPSRISRLPNTISSTSKPVIGLTPLPRFYPYSDRFNRDPTGNCKAIWNLTIRPLHLNSNQRWTRKGRKTKMDLKHLKSMWFLCFCRWRWELPLA